MFAKDLGCFDQQVEVEDKIGEFVLDQDQPRSLQSGGPVRYAERQASDRLGIDREAAGLQRETMMIGVQPEGFLGSIEIFDAHKPFTAQIEVKPRALERPFRRHIDLRMLKQ